MVIDKTTKVLQHICVGVLVVKDMSCLSFLPWNGCVLLCASCLH